MEIQSWRGSGDRVQLLVYRWEHWGPRSHRRKASCFCLAHIQLCRTLVLCRKSKLHQPAEVCGWLQGSWLTSFSLCPAVSSFHPEELLPVRGNIQPSPSMATARTVYTLFCHFRPPCQGDASMRNSLRGHSWIRSIHYRSLAMACSDYKGTAPNFFTE